VWPGQRILFFHDGRTGKFLSVMVVDQGKGPGATEVEENFVSLSSGRTQDLLIFLRSL
jgi:hypothetical protein